MFTFTSPLTYAIPQSHPHLYSRLPLVASSLSTPFLRELSRFQWSILLFFLLWIPTSPTSQPVHITKCQLPIPESTFFTQFPGASIIRIPEFPARLGIATTFSKEKERKQKQGNKTSTQQRKNTYQHLELQYSEIQMHCKITPAVRTIYSHQVQQQYDSSIAETQDKDLIMAFMNTIEVFKEKNE